MAFTNPWDESAPPGSDLANTIDTAIQRTKLDIRERIETVLPGWADDLEDPKEFPLWLVRLNGVINAPDATFTLATWDADDRPLSGFITVPSTTVTVPAGLGGFYIVGTTIGWFANAVGIRQTGIRLNGSLVQIDRRGAISGQIIYNQANRGLLLAPADTLDVQVFQNSGGNLLFGNVEANPELNFFWGIRIGG